MRPRTALLLTAAGIAGTTAALVVKRRYETLKATGSLNPDVDLSGAPLGPPPRRAAAPPAGDARILPPSWEPPPLTALARWVPPAPTTGAGRAAAYVWAAPLTLVAALLGLLSGARPQVREGVLVFQEVGGPAGAFLRLRGFRATAIGHTILSTVEPDPALLAHELVHVRHAERLGVFSALLYGVLYPVYGYARHPMERAARKAARQVKGAPA